MSFNHQAVKVREKEKEGAAEKEEEREIEDIYRLLDRQRIN